MTQKIKLKPPAPKTAGELARVLLNTKPPEEWKYAQKAGNCS